MGLVCRNSYILTKQLLHQSLPHCKSTQNESFFFSQKTDFFMDCWVSLGYEDSDSYSKVGLFYLYPSWNSPGQDTEVFSVSNQGSCSCQRLHPGTQKQQPLSGADRALLLPSLQAHTWQILCGSPGCCCRGILHDFIYCYCVMKL